MNKKIISSILVITIIVFSITMISINASAITGKIGNGRMILNLEQGDKLEKYIQVINDNNVSVNISVYSSGDLENNIEVLDENFMLNPGEDKRARFIITAGAPGNYEGKVNVAFKPTSNESGVGISAQIILNVHKKGTLTNETSGLFNFFGSDNPINSGTILIGSTIILIIGAAILFYTAKRKSKKRGEHEKSLQQVNKK
jgi:hypothetical protein